MIRSLGKITVPSPGTPIRLTANEVDSNKRLACHSMLIEALPGNTGKIYIGQNSSMNKTTLAFVIAILPVPTANLIASFSVTAYVAAGFHADQLWIDVDVANEGVLASYTQV
jgi:hypothetical protein